MARELLARRGILTGDLKKGSSYYIQLTTPLGTAMTVWVKCAYTPETGSGCAAMLTFPKGKDISTNEAATSFVEEFAERRVEQASATHILLLAADPSGHVPSAAFLLPILELAPFVEEGLATEGGYRMWNGAALDLWVVANPGAKVESVVSVLRRRALDLLREPPQWIPSLDAINDLDTPHFGNPNPERVQQISHAYQRDWKVRQQAIERAKGHCEHCGSPGFAMPNGMKYLEAHHIIALADDGEDTIRNVIALCPTHHREAHYGVNSAQLESAMVRLLAKLRKMP